MVNSGKPKPSGSEGWRLWLWLWLVIGLVTVLWVGWDFFYRGPSQVVAYSELKRAVRAGEVSEVALSPDSITARRKEVPSGDERQRVFSAIRVDDPQLVPELEKAGIVVRGVQASSLWRELSYWLIPFAVLFFLLRARSGGQASALAFGRSKARLFAASQVQDTFADVAGVDEAKDELSEVVDFLKNPQKLQRLGGRLPKGILLVGPPGTGKTLLARAVAGEAKVPFYSISGSEFVELFVGVGAARVRDLFAEAKRAAPCIIFIDELDAMGKVRGVAGVANDEREQTLNQLLVEMDGFNPRDGVVLMAATNRPEILDPALLRAGRFDRHVLVDRPDRKGRLEILKVHAKKVKLARLEELERIAKLTPGLAGADLANIVNEAALGAVRRGGADVTGSDLDEAVERVVAGMAKRNRVLTPAERERVAIHEVGHALLALLIPHSDAVQKISIIPRGISALGYTLQIPAEDRKLFTQPELETKIAVLLGGRAAEELVFHTHSTGAQDDLAKVTQLARSMVKSYGMSPQLGPLRFEPEAQPLFVGVSRDDRGDYGPGIALQIDREVRRIVDQEYDRAQRLLAEREPALRAGAKALLEREVLTGEELCAIADLGKPSDQAA